jgi:hypothetical protein
MAQTVGLSVFLPFGGFGSWWPKSTKVLAFSQR